MMTTYTITIEDLKPKQLLKLIDSLPFVAMHITKSKVEEPKANGKKKPYSSPEDKMSLTGKSAQKGSNREAILVTFEKLELKHGIGTVTRKMFREECTRKGQDTQIIYQLVREGYLKIL
ncbi:MAG: hypothetical protein KAJ19_28950 [Gammaproteobacteria bacterium]|nr:hypothetical protein [Gammaproteobacteria bacterium]